MDERRTDTTRVQQPLPFDDESEHPVPYRLTARARRVVAPEALPELELVTDVGRGTGATARGPVTEDGALEEPGDTRPARARALRRAGLSVAAIALQLDTDELTVRAWLGALAGRAASVGDPQGVRRHDRRTSAPPVYSRARDRAHREAPARLRSEPTFAAGLGLVAGVADLDEHSVAVTTRDPRVAAAVAGWLTSNTGTPPHRLRVVLRLGRNVAADVARHRWAAALGIASTQITHTRARGVHGTDEEALLRLADPAVAGTVAGWTQALLDPPTPEPLDAAF